MDKKTTLITIIVMLITATMVYLGSNPNTTYSKLLGFMSFNTEPKQLYRVYLGGKSIGLIESTESLENFIDEKQSELKEKYNVSKVYIPNDLDIIQEVTYNEKTSSVQDIYNKIKQIKGNESFTIDGYKIVINGVEKTAEDGTKTSTEDQTIYVLNKDHFTNAVETTIKLFVAEEYYDDFLNENQPEIKENEEGKIVEDLYIKNNITIKKDRIPAGAKIYQTEEELNKYLLFGTTDEQATYIVKAGDTIEEISYNNKLSPEEFLIANTEYKTANDLLYPGKKVVLGVIKPQFDTVEETHTVSKKTIQKQTIYKDDETQYTGYEKVEVEGEDGISLVTEKIQYTNGEITSLVGVSDATKIIKPVINKVIIRGTKKYTTGGSWSGTIPVGVGSWVWPTNAPYTITSHYGWRWGKLHEGLDIAGTGRGSPIKAANNGVVIQSGYTGTNGHYIVIAHSNGQYTMYAHLQTCYKQVNDVVYAGDQIGTMGDSGFATGVHLHFAIYNGYPYRGGVPINPFNIYR